MTAVDHRASPREPEPSSAPDRAGFDGAGFDGAGCGPGGARPPVLRARAVTESRATTFALACRLLPDDVRDDVYLLYLVFRKLDDLVDERDPAARKRVAAVAAWAAGEPAGERRPTPETWTLTALAARHPIPRDAVGDFCAGMAEDLAADRAGVSARFLTERDVDRYAYRVAGTVGVIMGAVLGVRDGADGGDARAAAAALGMAMQRTNILRDIDEDLAAGRLYLPAEALGRAGDGNGSAAALAAARTELVREGIARADVLYDEGIAGIRLLARGRAAITLAACLYREILREIERRGFGADPGRAVVPGPRKLLVAARAALAGR